MTRFLYHLEVVGEARRDIRFGVRRFNAIPAGRYLVSVQASMLHHSMPRVVSDDLTIYSEWEVAILEGFTDKGEPIWAENISSLLAEELGIEWCFDGMVFEYVPTEVVQMMIDRLAVT